MTRINFHREYYLILVLVSFAHSTHRNDEEIPATPNERTPWQSTLSTATTITGPRFGTFSIGGQVVPFNNLIQMMKRNLQDFQVDHNLPYEINSEVQMRCYSREDCPPKEVSPFDIRQWFCVKPLNSWGKIAQNRRVPQVLKNMASRKQKMVADTAEGVCRFTEKKNLQLVEHGVVSSRGTLSWNCNFDNDCPELFISRDNYPLEWKCTGKDDNWRRCNLYYKMSQDQAFSDQRNRFGFRFRVPNVYQKQLIRLYFEITCNRQQLALAQLFNPVADPAARDTGKTMAIDEVLQNKMKSFDHHPMKEKLVNQN
ncbi:uncharacterized protein LOC142356811 [Convolutriloba macropyga]|uniref:uncharacterized protein LOC142356811 n=1 Tax=Convolutriloba macropyga TaxID=536237 RepID=UPI003F526E32